LIRLRMRQIGMYVNKITEQWEEKKYNKQKEEEIDEILMRDDSA